MLRKVNIKQLPRLDDNATIKELLQSYCRLNYGEIWEDPIKGHRIGVLDATNIEDILQIAEIYNKSFTEWKKMYRAAMHKNR